MSVTTFSEIERRALWITYKEKCFLCDKVLIWDDLHIDHVIPEKLAKDDLNRGTLFKECGLDNNFDLNGYHNLVPVHKTCNLQKGGDPFSASTTRWYLERTAKKLEAINTEIKRLKEFKQQGRFKSSLVIGLEEGILEKNELLPILIKHNIVPKESIDLSEYIDDLSTLMESNQYRAALAILERFKQNRWENLSSDLKYKVTLNTAIAFFNLDEKERGAQYFIELLKYKSESSEAYGCAALGYSLIEDIPNSKKYAELAINIDPLNPNAYLAILFNNADIVSPTTIDDILPKQIRSKPLIAINLGTIYDRRGFSEEAFDVFNQLDIEYQKVDPMKYDIGVTLALNRIKSLSPEGAYWHGQISIKDQSKLDFALKKLDASWEFYEGTDLASSRWYIPMNRGVVKTVLGNKHGAIEDFKKALSYNKNYVAYRHLLINSLEDIELSNSIIKEMELLELSDDQTREVMLFKLQGKLFEGQVSDDEVEVLISQAEYCKDLITKLTWIDFTIQFLVRCQLFPKASSSADKLIELEPNSPRGYYHKANILHLDGSSKSDVLLYIDKARNTLNNNSRIIFIKDIVDLLFKLKEFKAAAEVLEPYTDVNQYSELTKSLLLAHFRAGNHKRGSEIAKPLSESNNENEFLLEYLSLIHTANKDYSEAIEALEKLVNLTPGDPVALINLAAIYAEVLEYDNARKVVEKIGDYDKIPVGKQFLIVNILLQSGELDEGWKLAFDIRKRFYSDIQTHQYFVNLCIRPRQTSAAEDELRSVVVPCHVILQNNEGAIHEYTIVEKAGFPPEISSTSSLAIQLLGKTVGDSFHFATEQYNVKEIMSIRTHAFRDSIKQLQVQHGNDGPLRQGKFPPNGTPEQMFGAIEDMIQPFLETAKKVEDLYSSGRITIGQAAFLSGMSVVNYWQRLASKPEPGLYTVGDYNEAFASYEALNEGKPIILDVLSLLTLHYTNSLWIICRIYNKIFVAKSTLDLLKEELKILEENSGRSIQHAERINGVLEIRIESPLETEQKFKSFQSFINELESFIQVVTPKPSTDYHKQKEVDNNLGVTFNQTIIIAEDNDYIVCSEDVLFRSHIRHQLGRPVTSVFILHNYFHRKNEISLNELMSHFHQRVRLNHRNIPMTADLLYKIFEECSCSLKQPFLNSSDTLKPTMSNDNSVVMLIGDFLYLLYSNKNIETRFSTAEFILKTGLAGRDVQRIREMILDYLRKKFRNLQLEYNELRRLLRTYY